jgi:hypothetical protein
MKWTAKKPGTTSTRKSSGAMIRRPAIDGGGKWRAKSPAEPPRAVDELQVTTLVRDLGQTIESAGRYVAVAANAALTTLYWQIGHRDLLFFQRRMRRLVAVELKIADFKPADSGRMELYLRRLDRHERQPDEAPPLGIILCAGEKRETVEYLDIDVRGIYVAEYLTDLPPREGLEERLHRAIQAARNRLVLSADLDVDATGPKPSASSGRARARKTR